MTNVGMDPKLRIETPGISIREAVRLRVHLSWDPVKDELAPLASSCAASSIANTQRGNFVDIPRVTTLGDTRLSVKPVTEVP